MFHLIPYPKRVRENANGFFVGPGATLYCDAPFLPAVDLFLKTLDDHCAFSIRPSQKEGTFSFIQKEGLPPEGYEIYTADESVTVYASSYAGALYGSVTLRQLLEVDLNPPAEKLYMPGIEIEDAPDYSWRGLMLDVSRHFFSVEEVKRLLDQMAFYKLNTFHWHLTDDNGWRIEVKKYPLLTETGAKRKGTHLHGWRRADRDPALYEGYYTQEQIREIVGYARLRHIMVVPEIDLPAHFRAAIAAYPELACRPEPIEVPWYFAAPEGVPHAKEECARIACGGKEQTYRFIRDLLEELCPLFPAPYFHIGGDEAPKDEWKKCPDCQKRIREHGLDGEEGLQGYLNERVAALLREKKKQLICWNDGLHAPGGADPSIVCQYYSKERDPLAEDHLKRGGSMILSRYKAFYYDISYAELPLRNVYRFQPAKEGVPPEFLSSILGMEGTLWTEWIEGMEKLEMNCHPRMEALAEKSWGPSGYQTFGTFLLRWRHFQKVLDQQGVNYAHKKIYARKSLLRTQKIVKAWYASDPNLEWRLNREFRKQKGRPPIK